MLVVNKKSKINWSDYELEMNYILHVHIRNFVRYKAKPVDEKMHPFFVSLPLLSNGFQTISFIAVIKFSCRCIWIFNLFLLLLFFLLSFLDTTEFKIDLICLISYLLWFENITNFEVNHHHTYHTLTHVRCIVLYWCEWCCPSNGRFNSILQKLHIAHS